jgi:Ulp1 family protease
MLVSLLRLQSPIELTPGKWLHDQRLFLNDVLITGYFGLLNARTFSVPGLECFGVGSGYFTFLTARGYNYAKVKNWGRRDPETRRPNISDLQLLLIPINWPETLHFTLAVLRFDCDPPSIEYYDPLHTDPKPSSTATKIVFPTLRRLIRDLAKSDGFPGVSNAKVAQIPATTWKQVPQTDCACGGM